MGIDLPLIWAIIIAFGLMMYVIMDGFDLGIGILSPFVPAHEDRDTMVNTVAPVWDGNETWLVLGGAALLAAFPLAYSVILSALYLPLVLMLAGLIWRGVAFEFRFKADEGHKAFWDKAFAWGSYIATFFQGVALGAFINGFRVEKGAYAGGLFDWLTPFSLFTGVGLLVAYALLGNPVSAAAGSIAFGSGQIGGATIGYRRRMCDDKGWIRTLMEEAENERMHLMTFIEIAKPALFERLVVLGVQWVFYLAFFALYLVSPRTAHRIVGYFEEEAVISYTHYLKEIDEGRSPNVPAPAIARHYWKLPADATLRDVVLVVRADEAHHRDVNHGFASELAGVESVTALAPYPAHADDIRQAA